MRIVCPMMCIWISLLKNKTIGFVIKIFVLSIFEWPFYTGFTVYEIKKDITKFAVFGVDR